MLDRTESSQVDNMVEEVYVYVHKSILIHTALHTIIDAAKTH